MVRLTPLDPEKPFVPEARFDYRQTDVKANLRKVFKNMYVVIYYLLKKKILL